MIETHCHVDLAQDPIGLARRLDVSLGACVAVTMLPKHYDMARKHLRPFPRIKLALGLHPLRANEGQNQIAEFEQRASLAQFIGEIGLDDSSEGHASLPLQKALFTRALAAIQPGSFVSVHSRGAWKDTLSILREMQIGPVCLHYFTGGAKGAQQVVAEGHYLSVNHQMIRTGSRHREWIVEVPRDRILAETDAPYTGDGDPVELLSRVYSYFADAWKVKLSATEEVIARNFERCRTCAR